MTLQLLRPQVHPLLDKYPVHAPELTSGNPAPVLPLHLSTHNEAEARQAAAGAQEFYRVKDAGGALQHACKQHAIQCFAGTRTRRRAEELGAEQLKTVLFRDVAVQHRVQGSRYCCRPQGSARRARIAEAALCLALCHF